MRLFSIFILFVSVCPAFGQNRWITIDKPTSVNLNRICFIDSANGWVAGDSGIVLHTTNGGASWVSQNTGISNEIHELFVVDRSFAWALAFEYPVDTLWYGTYLLKTTNGGTTWTRRDYYAEFYYALSFFDSVNGWMGGNSGTISKTTDGGLTWSQALIDSSIVSGFPVYHFDFYSRNYGFALGGRMDLAGVVWRTTNGGQRWSASSESGEPIHALHYVDSMHLVAVGGDLDVGSGMIQSDNGGGRWQYTYLGIWGEAKSLSFRTPAEGWATLGFAGTYMVTRDTGNTWEAFYSPDSTAMHDVVFIDSTHGFMVGKNGTILRYDPTIVGVDGHDDDLPSTFKLFQNYPNPFNPSTAIAYELSEAAFVTLRVCDATGREIRRFAIGNKEPGVHSMQFNGETLASGVYLYELSINTSRGRLTQVRKMMLLK